MAQYEATLAQQSSAKPISRRAYNLLTFGLVTLSFIVTYFMYNSATNGFLAELNAKMNPILSLVLYLAGSIAGLIAMNVGKDRQILGLTIAGYSLFTLTFGGTLAKVLTHYNVGTIYYAFAITACISGMFLIAGVIFPEFFSRIGGILSAALLGLLIAELVAIFVFHVDQTFLDFIAIALFGGCLGFYSWRMGADAPTVPNAFYYAANVYLAIVNILIRVLRLTNKR